MGALEEAREFWDRDAPGYDRSSSHRPSVGERAAWTAALSRLLPPPPARVLDVGAGTGFLSLMAAALGYRVTALDLSPGMLAALGDRARGEGLVVEIVEGTADQPPPGPFEAVIQRHLVWTLPDPPGTLRAWRRAAPQGTLVLFESRWGTGAGPAEQLRHQARRALHRLRRLPPDHHAPYPETLRRSLPLGAGTSPAQLVELTEHAGWGPARLERLRDVEWAAVASLPLPERLLGTVPRFAVTAGSAPTGTAD